MLSVQACRDPVVEGERVPGEPSAQSERRSDTLKGAAAVGPGRQVQERASIPTTRRPVSRATGIATRPVPTASSTSSPSASRASMATVWPWKMRTPVPQTTG
jgi:hypothetical protein